MNGRAICKQFGADFAVLCIAFNKGFWFKGFVVHSYQIHLRSIAYITNKHGPQVRMERANRGVERRAADSSVVRHIHGWQFYSRPHGRGGRGGFFRSHSPSLVLDAAHKAFTSGSSSLAPRTLVRSSRASSKHRDPVLRSHLVRRIRPLHTRTTVPAFASERV